MQTPSLARTLSVTPDQRRRPRRCASLRTFLRSPSLPPRRAVAASVVIIGLVIVGLGSPAPVGAGEVRTLRVVANGIVVPLAGDVVIQDSVVMAPYQGLFAPLGIAATYKAGERTLTLVSPAGDEMQLRAGDPYATINGERRPIPIPLVAVFDRVLIPIQWVCETLGDATTYDPDSHTLVISPQVTGISWRGTDAGLEITIDGTGPLHSKAVALHAPERLIVDVMGALPKSLDQVLDVHEGPLAGVRVARSAFGTRIVLDLLTTVQYQVVSEIPGRRVLISLAAGPIPSGGPSGGTPSPPSGYQPSAQKISDVLYQHVEGGGRLVIVANRPLRVTRRTLRNPDRIVIDVADAVFFPVKKILDINDGLVVQIRAAQFHSNPNQVRIVVQLSRAAPFEIRQGPEAGRLLVTLGDAAAGPETGPPTGPVVIAVDAGHGGSDPGAIGPTGVKEKDVALAIAQLLHKLVVQQHLDVVMIRDTDTFVPLEDRGQIAARGGATLFVSIHANASTDANASGTQTFYANPSSQPLAAAVLDEVSKTVGLAPRGTTQAEFKVLVDSNEIPAILVETAFITNPREEQMLRDPAVQQAFAQSILKGIQRFLAAPQAAP
ncbi:MAG TPA: N-acetylmuramoyl-L-alanine amidase [bacterium]|nr:N-acetylmuramoyl-L-alanine amidase [bacterium]